MNQEFLEITGAKEHNLKDISLKIPREKLVVITGLSGSGKSSLAFDTIYAEGQRRYMETFSSYARQFIGELERPDVEQITGLSPVISIEQKTTSRNPRSTVGTVTELSDFMRLLFARAADAYSHSSGNKMERFTEEQIFDILLERYDQQKIILLAPQVQGRKGHYKELFEQIRKKGFNRVRINDEIVEITPGLRLDRYKTHDIQIVVDKLQISQDKSDRLRQTLATCMKLGEGLVLVLDEATQVVTPFSRFLMDSETGLSYEAPSPNTFSFNSPYGACPQCHGLGQITQVALEKIIPDASLSINESGIVPLGEVRQNQMFDALRSLARKYGFSFSTPVKQIPKAALDIILYGDLGPDGAWSTSNSIEGGDLLHYGLTRMLAHWWEHSGSEGIRRWAEDFMHTHVCPSCNGTRLKKESLFFRIADKNIAEVSEWDLRTLSTWITELPEVISNKQKLIAGEVLKEIRHRIGFLLKVGLDYLHLNRPAGTLSGGEHQRIRLATQIGSQLTGITYILDEPSIGLHQRDNARLIEALHALTAIGNTVIVVEHDKDIMMESDYLIDLGPGAGKHGGQLVAQGTPKEFCKLPSITADYLSARKSIPVPSTRRKGSGKSIQLKGASGHNLQNVTAHFPLGTLICVTGVSGSGKSTLINETLYPILRNNLYRTKDVPLVYQTVEGIQVIDKVIEIDQSPIGRTPRSNPATYINVFSEIRNLYAQVPEAKIRGYKPGRFSFNVKGGRCETCEGAGRRTIEMNFLPDVEVHCETCFGKRYNRETLEIIYKGKHISDILDMTVDEAVPFFEPIPAIYRKIRTLQEVGLGYITLGQQATTLSGGEAQRVKLSEELSKRDTGSTFYILDEPTTGLHFEDIRHLLDVLNKLVDKGNTVLIIEHQMDVIKCADYIIDLGPEGGNGGGRIIATGTPEEVARNKESYTGKYLKLELKI